MIGSTTVPPTLPPLRGNFVLLRADGLQLLLPQQEVGAAQYLDARPRESSLPGWFELDGGLEGQVDRRADGAGDGGSDGVRHVAALSGQMGLLRRYPEGRFLLTSFEGQGDLLMCWNSVKVLIDAELQPRPLPAVMLHEGSPLREYVEFGDELAFCCTAQRLLEHAMAAGG